MGEMPLVITVKIGDDEPLQMVVYWCDNCKKEFLFPDILEQPYCPNCGQWDAVHMDLEYT